MKALEAALRERDMRRAAELAENPDALFHGLQKALDQFHALESPLERKWIRATVDLLDAKSRTSLAYGLVHTPSDQVEFFRLLVKDHKTRKGRERQAKARMQKTLDGFLKLVWPQVAEGYGRRGSGWKERAIQLCQKHRIGGKDTWDSRDIERLVGFGQKLEFIPWARAPRTSHK